MTGAITFLLIDANVALSATTVPRSSASKACTDLVQTIASRRSPVDVAMTPMLMDEWRRHASPMMIRWLAQMDSRRRVRHMKDRPIRGLRKVVIQIEDAGIREAVQKDLHLSEAGLLQNLPVVSCDDKQHRYLASLVESYPQLAKLQWANPVRNNLRAWVVAGCPKDEHRIK